VTSSVIVLTGLDGSNPLAFLAAVGTLRLADQSFPGRCRLHWVSRGKWAPVLTLPDGVTEEGLVGDLYARLHRTADPATDKVANQKKKRYEGLKKRVKDAEKRVKARKLRGKDRDSALEAEVEPLQREAEAARADWLGALAEVVPARFLALGKTLSVTADEFRRFTTSVAGALHAGAAEEPDQQERCRCDPAHLEDANFAAAFGSEACVSESGRIVPTEFQLIAGASQQFFLETFRILMEEITPEKIRRSLFGPWQYADPKRSFRWDPGEDRRYAYGWSDPSGDEVRTEHGANLLAAMGLPLFPAVPTERGLGTTGFDATGDRPTLTWPIWAPPVGLDTLRSLVALKELRDQSPDRARLAALGVVEVYRTVKIEVGRRPSSRLNLAPSVAV
jgi:hypothetical protein